MFTNDLTFGVYNGGVVWLATSRGYSNSISLPFYGVSTFLALTGVTPAQIVLAWVLAQGEDIVPIPGTRRIHYLEENVAVATITLTDQERARLNALLAPVSSRYIDMSLIGG